MEVNPASWLTLDYDPATETLNLIASSPALLRDPMVSALVRRLGGETNNSGTVRFVVPADEMAGTYQTISKLLERVGIPLRRSDAVEGSLAEVEREAQQFQEFARRASEIWHSEIDTEELQDFVDVLVRASPNRTFYRRQILAAYHLAFSQNACNFSVPGAGKTSVVYAAFAYLSSLAEEHPKHVNTLFVVGPLSSFKAWEDEFRAIFDRPPRARRITGGSSLDERVDFLRGITRESREVELVMTSYPTLASMEDEFRVFLTHPMRQVMFVLDEAHYIKRFDGYWASAALRLAPLARSRVVLTGTPAPNGYEDLSNLFRFIYPNRNIVQFPVPSLKAMTRGEMRHAIPMLKERIQPFYTRIKKSDLGLPSANDVRVPIQFSEDHKTIYRALERRIVPGMRHELDQEIAPIRLRARLIRLRQAAVNPSLLLRPLEEDVLFAAPGTDFSVSELEIANLIEGFQPERDLKRLQVLRQIVSEVLATQGRVLVWSYFLGNLDLIRTALNGMADFTETISGATPVGAGEWEDERLLGTREDIIDRFHETRGSAILIANPQAVGESVSLHKACRTSIYFDRDFNAGRYIQSKDRIHRYDPNGGLPVTHYQLLATDSVDEVIDERLRVKESRLEDLMDSEDIPLFVENPVEDIEAILKNYEQRHNPF